MSAIQGSGLEGFLYSSNIVVVILVATLGSATGDCQSHDR